LQGGPARTGDQPDEAGIGAGNVSKLSQVRTYKTNFGSTAPLIANGILYVATNQLYAFDATGASNCSATPSACTPLWTAPVAYIHGMAIADGHVYVTDNEGVQAFDAAGSENCSGTPKVCAPLWTGAMSGNETNTAAPAVADGIVYVSNSMSGLYAFDATGTTNCSTNSTGKTCAPLWNAPSAAYGGAPAVANGVVYEITDSGKLAAFDATATANCPGTSTVKTCTRAPLWTSASLASGPLTASPTVANGVVYASSSNGGMYAYDAAGSLDCAVPDTTNSGTLTTVKACSPLWSGPATGFTGGGSPAIVNGVLYVNVPGAATVYAYSL